MNLLLYNLKLIIMDNLEQSLLVLFIAFVAGIVAYGIYLLCLHAKYTKKLRVELANKSITELENVVQRTGYLLNTHGDLLSISSALYYRIRYVTAKKMLREKQKNV